MKVFAVRIGNRYGVQYEDYINEKLGQHYDIVWIRKAYHPEVMLQWNKMLPMSLDIDEPVCVVDIDVLLVNDYLQLFEYPIQRGQFLGIPGWWRNDDSYVLNGGFFKYYPKDCRYIFDEFMSDIEGWQRFYIDNGVTRGPVNGEQHFVEDMVIKELELLTTPKSWVTRWLSDEFSSSIGRKSFVSEINHRYSKVTGNDYLYLGGDFHEDVKMVHFTNTMNLPHQWNDYGNHR